jgi:hypothetical protein
MKTKLLLLVLGVLFINFISFASAIYPGETLVVKNALNTTNLNYSIIQNNTHIIGLGINITKQNIKITLPTNMPPTTFSILFVSKEKKQEMRVKIKKHFLPNKQGSYWFSAKTHKNWFNFSKWKIGK